MKSRFTDSTPLGKFTFPTCYHKARLAGITEKNIIAGWKSSGLWPVSLSKPLMKPMVSKLPEHNPSPPRDKNAAADEGNTASMPFPNASFTESSARYTFKHLIDRQDRENCSAGFQEDWARVGSPGS
ncbi:hypothetical protein EDB80DRAFT_739444 [Ilyonectria destructans]|nr:hypothetical protein EDB80DRAFT_739444 [Ilyonectria destructans]